MQQLRQNRWEPVEPLVLISFSHQMKLVDFGVLSLVGSAFLQGLGLARAAPLAVSCRSWSAISVIALFWTKLSEIVQEKTKQNPRGKEKTPSCLS